MAYSFNKNLQAALEAEFRPLGIVPFSNCCRLGCSGTFEEEDPDFDIRSTGVFFIRLHLNGLNYRSHPQDVYARTTTISTT